MKKLAAIALALVMCIGMVSCGDSETDSSSKTEGKKAAASSAAVEGSKAEAETTTTEAEPEVPLNTNVVHKEFTNTVLNMTANFDIANIDGFETQEGTQNPDQYRATGGYGYPDPEWYASAITIEYTLRPISAFHVTALEEKTEYYENFEKTDFGSAYDTYVRKGTDGYENRYDLIFVGGDYLDGEFVIEFTVMPQLDSGKAEDVELIVDTLARSLKLEADDSILRTDDGFSIAQNGITCKNKATVAGEEVEVVQAIATDDNYISAQADFVADGIGYSFRSLNVDGIDRFGYLGGNEYADCTIAGKPGKIMMVPGAGTLEVFADVQIDDENVLHMAISSDSALSEGELTDMVKLGEAISDMLSDENKEETQEKFVGYISDILASFSF
ncbi:MAG: hypothetical protein IJ571_10090 [Ruminococcus sp.]|nr:hypothetical protein [Ruminococcus sp.]